MFYLENHIKKNEKYIALNTRMVLEIEYNTNIRMLENIDEKRKIEPFLLILSFLMNNN